MKGKTVFFFIIIMLFTFSPGCWDIKDVNNTAFAICIGIDKAENSHSKYLVTLEFAKPAPGQLNTGTMSLVSSVEADSILQAMQSFQTDISRDLSLSHLRVVVIGEEIAKEKNIKDITNYLMREPKVALRLRLVFVEEGKAQDLFYTKHTFQQLLAAEIVDFAQAQQDLSLARTHNFLNFIRDLNNTAGIGLASKVTIKGDKKVISKDGAAVYKNWKLAAWLNAEEAQAANWLTGETNPIVVTKEGENTYTYRITNWSKKMLPIIENGELSFLVTINTTGMIMEQSGKEIDFSKPDNLKKMEQLFTTAIKQQVDSALLKSQSELEADYLGFGKAFEQYYPQVSKSMNWNEFYPAVPIEVQVSCKVIGYGLRS